MSETATQVETPPLNPETAAETPVETGGEPKAHDFSKPLQKVQMENANMRRELADLKGMLEEFKAARTTVDKKDALDDLQAAMDGEQGQQFESMVPGLSKTLKAIAARVKEGGKPAVQDPRIEALEKRLEASEKFGKFMSDKTPEFRKAYAAYQRELEADLREEGEEYDAGALAIAMRQFVKGWKEPEGNEGEETPAPAKPTGGKKPVIPANTGARHTGQKDPMEVLRSGHFMDEAGNIRPGNLLGIK